MNKLFLSISILTCIYVPDVLAQRQIVQEVDDGRIVDQVAVVGDSAESLVAVRGIASAFVKRYAGRRAMFRLIIAPSRAVADRSTFRPPIPANLTYDGTIKNIEAIGLPGPVARVFGMSGRALLTFRNGTEFHEEILLGSGNPTSVAIGTFRFDILHFELKKVGIVGQPYHLTVFAKAIPSVSVPAVGAFVRKMAALSSSAGVSVMVRSDIWFFEHAEYPYLLPFVRDIAVPKYLDYVGKPEVSCDFLDRKTPLCAGQSFVP